MSNAGSLLFHRFAGLNCACTQWPRPAIQLLRQSFHCGRNLDFYTTQVTKFPLASRSKSTITPLSYLRTSSLTRSFSQCETLFARKTEAEKEPGLAFQDGDLSKEVLQDVFGAVTPPVKSANRLLRVLHGRRNDGTLDLDLPLDLQVLTKRYPYAMDSALYWLRSSHPIDEDAAILARIEREETGEDYSPSELEQRAQDLNLYAPQSGNYQAKLSETEGDVFGRSEIDRIRARNIAKAEEEEQQLQQQIDQIMHEVQQKQDQQNKSLAARPDSSLETTQTIRPPNEFEKWILRKKNESTSTLNLPAASQTPFVHRILPSFIFVTLFVTGCYLFATYWVPPKRTERIFPDISLSFATIGTIFVINGIVMFAWSLPMFWPILNKYFISTPASPRALSMIGNVFSHQKLGHFAANMACLFVFGLSLHEDVGRGVFLGTFLAAGAMGSLASMMVFAARRQFVTSSLGASGGMWGVMAAYCWVHSNEKFSFIFFPPDWQDKVKFSGWYFLSILILIDIIGFFSPVKRIDYASHLAGMATGLVSAEAFMRNEKASGNERQRKKGLKWYEILVGKQLIVDK